MNASRLVADAARVVADAALALPAFIRARPATGRTRTATWRAVPDDEDVPPMFDKSSAAQARLHELVPGGAHTYARGSDQYPEDMAPVIARGFAQANGVTLDSVAREQGGTRVRLSFPVKHIVTVMTS